MAFFHALPLGIHVGHIQHALTTALFSQFKILLERRFILAHLVNNIGIENPDHVPCNLILIARFFVNGSRKRAGKHQTQGQHPNCYRHCALSMHSALRLLSTVPSR